MGIRWSSALVALFAISTAASADSLERMIDWRVANPYPLLRDATVKALASKRGSSPTAFYDALVQDWTPGQAIVTDIEQTMFDRSTGLYRNGFVLRRGEPVQITVSYLGPLRASEECVWRIEGAEDVAAGCVDVELKVPMGIRTRVSVRPGGLGIAHSTVVEPVQEVTVAMGDSYASGEGNPDVPAVYPLSLGLKKRPGSNWIFEKRFCRDVNDCGMSATPSPGAQWWDPECHRSLMSWPVLSTLWRATARERKQTRHVLIDYACSGAGILDGVFYAQLKLPTLSRRTDGYRDGLPRAAGEGPEVIYSSTTRSQVNAVLDQLCQGRRRKSILFEVQTTTRSRAWLDICDDPLPIDHLFLSIGGNDLKFGSIAMGTLVPIQAKKGLLRAPALWLSRRAIGAASPDESLAAVDRFKPHYMDTLRSVTRALNIAPSQTIVVKYPNPIVAVGASDEGCVAGQAIESNGSVTSQRARVRDVQLVMGHVLPRMSLHLLPLGWTVEVSEGEVVNFRSVFKQIERMQVNERVQEAHDLFKFVEFGPAVAVANGQRLCDFMEQPLAMDLPLFFCDPESILNPTCEFGKKFGGNWQPRSPIEYLHYSAPGKTPRKSVVYSMNEAVMAQRTWLEKNPSMYDITEALSGTMHPTAEAHAAAALEVVKELGIR